MAKKTSSLLSKTHIFFLFSMIFIFFCSHSSMAQDNNLIDIATPDRLISAVKRSNEGSVRFLIRGGVNPNTDFQEFNRTPLMWAAKRGDIEMSELLIEEGADVNLTNAANGETALVYAIQSGDIDVVKYFVEVAKANLHHWRQTVLISAIVLDNVNMDIIRYLASRLGDDVNARDRYGATALMHAALYGYMDIVQFLVEEVGANIYLQDVSGASAVVYAVDGGYTNIADYIIDVGTEGFLRLICKTTSYYLCNQQMYYHQ